MDLNMEVGQTTSKILFTILLIIFISGCGNKKNETGKIFSLNDSVNAAAIDNKTVDTSAGKKTIYLTFDDGPNRGTGNVIKIAKEEKIPISMFLIGVQLHGSPGQEATYRRILEDSLIEIDNHSYSHAHNHFDKFYTKPQEVIKDFDRCADSLHLTAKIIRTPGRNIWRLPGIRFTDIKKCCAAADSFYKAGFKIVGWDVEWPFNNHLALTKTPTQMLQKIDSLFSKKETKTSNQLVLLAHDQSFADSEDSASLHSFIKQLKADKRYQFKMISAYTTIKN